MIQVTVNLSSAIPSEWIQYGYGQIQLQCGRSQGGVDYSLDGSIIVWAESNTVWAESSHIATLGRDSTVFRSYQQAWRKLNLLFSGRPASASKLMKKYMYKHCIHGCLQHLQRIFYISVCYTSMYFSLDFLYMYCF